MEKLAPDLCKVTENLDKTSIKEFLMHGYDVNFHLNATNMTLWSLLMSVSSHKCDSTKKAYIEVLKCVKKFRPNLFVVDKLGRTCFHHAALAGNSLGLQFCTQMLDYFEKKNTGVAVEEGVVIPAVRKLVD